jgi:sigma-B regulation protein RsbU (phosphoserine phosphatase)
MRHFEFLTGDLARDRRNVDLLLGAVERMYGHDGVEDVLRHVVDSAIQVTGTERGVLLLADERDHRLTIRVSRGRDGRDLVKSPAYSRTVAQRVWASNTAEFTPNRGAGDPSESQAVLRAFMAAPLPGRSRPVGVLYVDSGATAQGFSAGDQAVFTTLAGLAVAAIERAEHAEARRQMEVARTIQRSMAPEDLEVAGLDVACEGRSALETSGDYHDVVPFWGRDLCLVVGDVCGKGLGAALHMVSARAALRTLLEGREDPLSVLGSLNAYLCSEMPSGEFVTLSLVFVESRTRTLRWAGAGHKSFHWRRGEGVTELCTADRPLGLEPGATYEARGPLALAPGDAVVLCTDGLYEAFDETGDMYGEERLQASISARAARDHRARPLLDGILADLAAHVGTRRPGDDVTCIVLRVLDGPAEARPPAGGESLAAAGSSLPA